MVTVVLVRCLAKVIRVECLKRSALGAFFQLLLFFFFYVKIVINFVVVSGTDMSLDRVELCEFLLHVMQDTQGV